MATPYTRATVSDRRGITLLEVLISIGILAIGLTSVLSLIPAGKSEAGKAVIIDRAVAMAQNAMADAVTFGYTRPGSFIALSSTATTIIFDPTLRYPAKGLATRVNNAGVVTSGTLKAVGVRASPTSTTPAPPAVGRLFSQGRDDLAYTTPAGDDLPLNVVINGIRSFQGRTTCLAALTLTDTESPPWDSGEKALLSIVVFHNRDASDPILSSTLSSTGLLTLTQALPADRSIRSIIRPNAVIALVVGSRIRFGQLSMAAADSTTNTAYVSFSGSDLTPSSSGGPVVAWVLVDSVALLERSVRLEGTSNFSQ